MHKAVFLDRDGVINQKAPEGQYVTQWEDMKFLPGVAEAMALLQANGYLRVVVSNQRCIAKGSLTVAELEQVHRACWTTSRFGELRSTRFSAVPTMSSPLALVANPRRACCCRLPRSICQFLDGWRFGHRHRSKEERRVQNGTPSEERCRPENGG